MTVEARRRRDAEDIEQFLGQLSIKPTYVRHGARFGAWLRDRNGDLLNPDGRILYLNELPVFLRLLAGRID